MTDQTNPQPDAMMLATAAFLQQVLELEDDPTGLAREGGTFTTGWSVAG